VIFLTLLFDFLNSRMGVSFYFRFVGADFEHWHVADAGQQEGAKME